MTTPNSPQPLQWIYPITFIFLFISFARSAQADVAYSLKDKIPEHVMIPRMSDAEFSRVSWSNESLTLQKNGGKTIYHNYTITNEDGHQRSRWTKREYIPKPSPNSLERRYMAMIHTTQWGSNKWPTDIGGRPVIPYCYENQDTKTQLREVVEEAMERWDTALGKNAGIRFVLNCEEFCGDIVGARPVLNINILKDISEGMHTNYTGFGGYGPDDNGLFVSLEHGSMQANSEDDTQLYTQVGGVAHELGHVLGLGHEHQRPDALKEISFYCKKISGYEAMSQKLQNLQKGDKNLQWPENSGVPATMDHVCSHAELAWPALEFSDENFDVRPFVPMPADLYPVSTENLDRKSIMLYSTTLAQYVLWWRDGSPISLNHYPSEGDVAGVKSMYPDIDPDVPLHQSAPTSSSVSPPKVPPRPVKSRSKSRLPPPKPLESTSLRPSGPQQGNPLPPPVPARLSARTATKMLGEELLQELGNVGF